MIIIEGPDGAGKTTLGKQLLAHGIVDNLFESPKRTNPEVPLPISTHEYLKRWSRDHRVAVDRLIFSEFVYGMIMRSRCVFTPMQVVSVLNEVFESGSIIIFCLPPVNSLVFKKDEDVKTIQNIDKIRREYGDWAILCRSISRKPANILAYQWTLPMAFDTLCGTLRRLRP